MKEVLVYADEVKLEWSWGDLLQMLGEIRTSSILFGDIENDEDNQRIVFHLEKNNSVHFRTSTEQYGETKLSTIVSFQYDEGN